MLQIGLKRMESNISEMEEGKSTFIQNPILKNSLTAAVKEGLEKMANEYYIERLIKIVPSQGLENLSYAQDMLINMVKERTLRSFCTKYNIPHSDIYRMATGERAPGYYIILALCEVIPPILWFISIDEAKPKTRKIKTTPIEKAELKNTLGFKELEKLGKDELIELKIDKQAIYKLKTGKTRILTFKRMIEFSPKINPTDWFIFEE